LNDSDQVVSINRIKILYKGREVGGERHLD
jgi:hypothetical protein